VYGDYLVREVELESLTMKVYRTLILEGLDRSWL